MSASKREQGPRLSVAWSTGLLLTAMTSIADVLGRLRYGNAQYAFFSDDFFYYARIARNIAYHGASTFDGTTITNGYHPLWMLVLVGLWHLGGDNHFIVLVLWCIVFSAFAVYCLVFSIARVLGTSRLGALMMSLWAVGSFLVVDSGGMEGVLAVPLTFATLRYLSSPGFKWSTVQCVMYGLLAALTVLARVDTSLFLATLLILQILLIRGPLSVWMARLGWFILGSSPLLVYSIINKLRFGQSFPISGTAKTLKLGLHFSPVGLGWTFGAIRMWKFPISQILLLAILILFCGFLSLLSRRTRSLPRLQLSLLCAGLFFPVAHIAALAILGDWQLFFIWYYYTFVIADVCGLLLLCAALKAPSLKLIQPVIWAECLSIGVISVLFGFALRLEPRSHNYTYTAAVHIAEFARSHPGRYAMGDRGAIVGYLLADLGDPMVQTEGIVMDRAFLDKIRRQEDLISTLRAYNVDYYIATEPDYDGHCFHLEEPAYAGPYSPKMRSVVCEQPLYHFVDPNNDVFVISKR